MVKRKKDPGYLYARKYGAKANIELHVIDDDGKPVPDANVEVFMGMNLRNKGRWITGTTNTNGVFLVKGKTTGDEIEYYIKKDGYYRTFVQFTFAEMGKESNVVNGKWQPYGEKETIKLRKIKKPYIDWVGGKWVNTNKLNEWVGFDIQKGDFVKPHGKGEISDFEIMFEWDGILSGKKYNGMLIKIRFKDLFSGYYKEKIIHESDFKTPFNANIDNKYNKEAIFETKLLDNGKYYRNHFDKNYCWVIRSRCVVDDNGNLLCANYSVINMFTFSPDKNNVVNIIINGYFNSTPNDTNLEPKHVLESWSNKIERNRNPQTESP